MVLFVWVTFSISTWTNNVEVIRDIAFIFAHRFFDFNILFYINFLEIYLSFRHFHLLYFVSKTLLNKLDTFAVVKNITKDLYCISSEQLRVLSVIYTKIPKISISPLQLKVLSVIHITIFIHWIFFLMKHLCNRRIK